MLKTGNCTVNYVRDLSHRNKSKLVSSYRIPRSVAYVEKLSEQKVTPALALLRTELASALEKYYGKVAKGTWVLLRMINEHVTQPLFAFDARKGYETKEAIFFSNLTDARLKCIKYSFWSQNHWFMYAKSSPVSNTFPVNDSISA